MKEKATDIQLIKGYTWIVCDRDLLGGAPAVKGTRIPVSLILRCLSEKMTPAEIADDYPGFPVESISEILKFAAEKTSKPPKKSSRVAA